MSAVPGKEFRLLHATHLIQNRLNKKDGFSKPSSEPLDQLLTDEDRALLRNFLGSQALKNILTQISFISRITQSPSKSSPNKLHTNLRPLITNLRPRHSDDRNCLDALNGTQREIKKLLARGPEGHYPDAQELYNILSNDFVRELLVAVDDTGNCCYTTFVDQDLAATPVYVELDPLFLTDGEGDNERGDNLNSPFSPSSASQDVELSTVRQLSEQQDVEHPSKDGHQLPSPSDSLPLSTAWDLTQASSYTPPLSPPHHRSPIPESPRKIPKSSPPHHSPGSRVGGAGPKHPALPSYVENSLPEPGMLRTIYIHRTSPEEPLGITLSIYDSSQMPIRSGSLLSLLGKQIQRGTTKDPPKIIIQRIIVGSLADKEGKLFPGDELIELNGVTATSLEAVQKAMFSATHKNVLQMVVKTPGIGQLKAYILSRHDPEHKVYIRCLFKYDPLKDTLLPNANLGVSFKSGDVLELVDSQDLNWWQVRRLDTPNSPVGLVPSQTLQERRQAFNQQARTFNTMKKIKEVKSVFRAADSSNLLVRSDLWVYEEVVPWPPSPIPTLLLIGPNGVGRRTIKFLLCTQFPQRFAFPISDTTDSTATPALFRIRTKEDMENDIRQGAYVEWGTVDGHHYGIRFAAIREIIATGRTALIDCQCQSVYLLHQPEFNPHVVFVSAPKYEIAKAMMDAGIRKNLTVNKRTSEEIHKIVEESKVFASQNQHLYAHTLVNSNMAESVEKLSQLVARLERQPGWIPAGWAYEMGLPRPLGKDGKREDRPSRLSIVGLPDDNRSVLSRVTSSMRSTASPESAVRLARPPSVCSSLQLPGTVVKGSCGIPPVGRWRYEKRNMVQPIQPPLSPLGSSTDQEIGSDNSTLPQPLPIERNLTSKTAVQSQAATRPAIGNPTSSKPPDLTKQQIFPHSGAKSNVRLKLSRGAIKANGGGGGDGNNANDDGDDDAISSTSSEDA